jgi:hypothetical protein
MERNGHGFAEHTGDGWPLFERNRMPRVPSWKHYALAWSLKIQDQWHRTPVGGTTIDPSRAAVEWRSSGQGNHAACSGLHASLPVLPGLLVLLLLCGVRRATGGPAVHVELDSCRNDVVPLATSGCHALDLPAGRTLEPPASRPGHPTASNARVACTLPSLAHPFLAGRPAGRR